MQMDANDKDVPTWGGRQHPTDRALAPRHSSARGLAPRYFANGSLQADVVSPVHEDDRVPDGGELLQDDHRCEQERDERPPHVAQPHVLAIHFAGAGGTHWVATIPHLEIVPAALVLVHDSSQVVGRSLTLLRNSANNDQKERQVNHSKVPKQESKGFVKEPPASDMAHCAGSGASACCTF
jgi:hypothetical protein